MKLNEIVEDGESIGLQDSNGLGSEEESDEEMENDQYW
jgi:hypothetical protein